jgi:uncharacterized protein
VNNLVVLGGCVFLAFVSETVVGFGSTIVALSLGAYLFPIDFLLPVLVPVNLTLSAYLVARDHRAISWGVLLRRILPWMALGMPVGLALFSLRQSLWLRNAFAAFVVLLSALELWRMRAGGTEARGLPGWQGGVLLAVGGLIHGVFGTGGPMVVYVVSRDLGDKRAFRSTLAVLWLILSLILVGGYLIAGALTVETLRSSAYLLPALVAAVITGELLFGRVPARYFRVLILVVLLGAGTLLLIKGL